MFIANIHRHCDIGIAKCGVFLFGIGLIGPPNSFRWLRWKPSWRLGRWRFFRDADGRMDGDSQAQMANLQLQHHNLTDQVSRASVKGYDQVVLNFKGSWRIDQLLPVVFIPLFIKTGGTLELGIRQEMMRSDGTAKNGENLIHGLVCLTAERTLWGLGKPGSQSGFVNLRPLAVAITCNARRNCHCQDFWWSEKCSPALWCYGRGWRNGSGCKHVARC